MKRNICSKFFLEKTSDPQIHHKAPPGFPSRLCPPLSLAGAIYACQASFFHGLVHKPSKNGATPYLVGVAAGARACGPPYENSLETGFFTLKIGFFISILKKYFLKLHHPADHFGTIFGSIGQSGHFLCK